MNIVTNKALQPQYTKCFLLDARSAVSQAAEGICSDELVDFHNYLEQNKLEFALDMLDVVTEKSPVESLQFIELKALAAASMGLTQRQRLYDQYLTDVRGWEYQTNWQLLGCQCSPMFGWLE